MEKTAGRGVAPEKRGGKAVERVRGYAESGWVAFLLCLVFTLAMVYHYVVPLNALPFTEGIKGNDCGQMVWNLWFVSESITSGRNPYATGLIYYPLGTRLAHHTLAAGFFPVTFLVKQLSGGSRLYPFYAYRIIILLSLTLILYCSYRYLRGLGFDRWAAAIPAVAYAFSNFYMEHVLHLNHLAGFFIPLAALCLVRLYRKPTTTNIVCAALVSSSVVYFTEFALYIYMSLLLLTLILYLTRGGRKIVRERVHLVGFRRILLALTIFLLIIAPFIANLSEDRVLKPTREESSFYSSNLAAFFIPVKGQTPLYGDTFAPLSSRMTAGLGEPGVFISFPLMAFGLVALIKSRRRLVRISALLSLFFFVLSLGPTLKVFSVDTGVPMPYTLLMRVPPFDLSRTPVRFVVMGLFFLMIVAAQGVGWTGDAVVGRWGTRWRTAMMSALLIWTIAEAHSPMTRRKPFVPPQGVQRIVPGPVLNLPLLRNDGYAAMLQIFHHQPVVTGYLARYTEAQWGQFAELERLFKKGGAQFCDGVANIGARNIILGPENMVITAPSIAPLELSRCPINVVDLREWDAHSSGPSGEFDRGKAERPGHFPLYVWGERIDLRDAQSDKYLWYGWSGREPAFRWTDGDSAAFVFALAETRPSLLRIKLGPFLAPGKLDEQRAGVELNGRTIATLRLRDAAPKEYQVALPGDLLRDKNVLTFALPDAESPRALKISDDSRLLGINVEWLEIEPQSSDR